ncbi:glycoside hydrolase domain-containing protein [Cohnella soli]|uniref:Glycoside hydrolase domain-containing protein n=1 Tax=Cohnella soli TaxID=425005 RepID=A0ABW0HL79_9BACL
MKKWKSKSKRWALQWIILCLVIPVFAGVGHAPKAAATATSNLIDNGGFELLTGEMPVAWGNTGNANFGVSHAEKHSGNSSVYFDYPDNGDWQVWLYNWNYASSIPIDESKDYEFSVWVKAADSSQAGLPSLNLDYYGDSGYIRSAGMTLSTPLTGDWQQLVFKLPLRLEDTAGVKRVIPYLLIRNGAGRVYFDDISFVQLNADTDPEPAEGTYSVWTAPSVMNLKRDAAPLSATEVNLEMAKREYQSGQVLLTAKDGYVNITNAEISDLTTGNATIPASQVEILVQQYIKTTKKSNGVYEPGWYPDALIPYSPYMALHGSIQVQSGNNQAIWFTVKSEENTPAGVYTGTISITVNGSVAQVPITVKVRDFALPEQNHAKTAFAIWDWMLPSAYPGLVDGSPEYWAIYRNYYEFLLNYHVTPTYLPIPWDYENYAENAKPYVSDPRVSAYNIPYTIGDFDKGPNGEPSRAEKLVQSLKNEHLLDKAYYYLGVEIDEPTPDKFPLVNQRSQQIAAIDPDLRHIVTTSLHPDLINNVDTFAPLFREFESEQYLQKVKDFQKSGGNMWWYGCVVPTNPYPTYHLDDDLISARLIPWMQRSYGIEGNLYWSVNVSQKWTGTQYIQRDIWNDPLVIPGANGDGYLLYPGYKYGMKSPIATMRLQAIRDGNQDYEYLWLLEDRIKQAAQQLGVEVSAKELIQPYYDRLFTNVKSFTKDPQELQQVRSEIADFIEELAMNPQSLVVFEDQPNQFSKKEVIVYAPKGTEVSINNHAVTGQAMPGNTVSDRYSYVMDLTLGMNDVTVKLAKGGIERTLTKRVMIKSLGIDPIMMKKVIHNFPDQQSISGITTAYGAMILGITEDHATGEGKALKVKIPASNQVSYPGLTFPVREGMKNFTWAQTVELDIYNATNEPRDVYMKLFDKNGAASDHHIGSIVAGSNHLSFDLSGISNDKANISSLLLWFSPSDHESELYVSDLHLLGIDTEAMKQYELPFTQVIPYLDGKLNEQIWNERAQLTNKTGVTDNAATISMNYNDEFLYVAASVKDDHVVNSGAANPWDDDSLEIYVDGTGKKGAYDDHTVKYVFRVNDPQVYVDRVTPRANEKVKYSYAATTEGYNMEIAIPWQSLGITPAEGNIIGITAHVNDKDINNANAPATGKLTLTGDSSQDTVSSSAWLPRKFVKKKMVYSLESVKNAALNIDGVIDEAAWNTNWNIGYQAFGNLQNANNGGRLGLLWSPEYLYAAFDVKDGHIRTTTTNPVWEDTSVELFVDSNFVQGQRDSGTHQYTLRLDDPVTYYNGAPDSVKTQGIIQKSTRTADGYQVEMAIPWTTIGITAEAGKKIGATAHINLVEPNTSIAGVALSMADYGLQDGASTSNYVAFEMKEPPVDPVDPSTPGGSTGTGEKAGSQSSHYIVKLQDITAEQPVITLKSGQEAAEIPLDILKQLRQEKKPLTIRQGDAQLELRPEWMDELLKSSEAAGSDKLILGLRALEADKAKGLASLAANKQYADVSLPDKVWEVLVTWMNGDNAQAAKPFKAPLLLSWPVAQEKQANYHIYRIGTDGELVYLKEDVSGDRLSAQLLQGGQVAGLIFVKKFDDLSKVQWALEAIRELAARQIIKGSSATTFAPAREITRAEFATILARALGLEENGRNTFTDVSSDSWFAGAVNAVAQAGLVMGQGNDRFAPQAAITREEMAVMLKRALDWRGKQAPQSAVSHSYTDDAQISPWAREATQALAGLGIMNGRGNNQFAPQASVNRAEAAQSIYHYLKKE